MEERESERGQREQLHCRSCHYGGSGTQLVAPLQRDIRQYDGRGYERVAGARLQIREQVGVE